MFGTISLACLYSSYRYIPLADATTLRFTSPVFIAIFAHFFANEPFGLLQLVNSATTLTGVVLIGRPSFLFSPPLTSLPVPLSQKSQMANLSDPSNSSVLSSFEQVSQSIAPIEPSSEPLLSSSALIGVMLSLAASITISISMIFMKRLKHTPAPLVIFWFSFFNVLLGTAGVSILGEFRMPNGLVVCILLAVTSK